MANEFRASTVIDRPIEDVFAFLADGQNDRMFSPRVQQIEQITDGPVGVGTVYANTVKDAGMTTQRRFELTAFEQPTRIHWTERSKNMITVPSGGYELTPSGIGTRLEVFNEFEGQGFGKLILPLALRAARKDADAFAGRIKAAVETSP